MSNGKISHTEPSTPLRSSGIDTSGIHGSFSTTRDGTNIRLPPYELAEVTARLRESGRSDPRPRSRSRPRTPTPRDTPKGTPKALSNRVSRRASQVIEQRNRRRRRSSMLLTQEGEPVYDPTYVGPITIDYLRFWAKVSIKEKEKEKEAIVRQVSSRAPSSPQEHLKIHTSIYNYEKSPDVREFNQSLPLPQDSEGILQSPFRLEKSYNEKVVDSPSFEEYNPPIIEPTPAKAKTVSYLEKILLARKLKKKSPTALQYNPFDDSAEPSPQKDHFNIENEISNPRNQSFHIRNGTALDAESLLETNVYEASSEIPKPPQFETNFNPEEPSTNPEITVSEPLEQDQDFETYPYEHIEDVLPPSSDTQINVHENESTINVNPPPFSPPAESPNKLVTPPSDLNVSPYERSDTSNQIIQEEYTLGDEISNTFLDIESSQSDMISDQPLLEPKDQPDAQVKQNPSRILSRPTSGAVRQSNSQIPITAVKNLVKSIRHHNHDNINIQPLRKKLKRPQQLTRDVYGTLQEKSDEFLDSLVSDLHAYANHRSSAETPRINLSDVLLYLNRVNFVGAKENRENDIKRISTLAQNYLPLELLISLDENLNSGKLGLESIAREEEKEDVASLDDKSEESNESSSDYSDGENYSE